MQGLIQDDFKGVFIRQNYCTYSTYSYRQANSVDTDQMLHSAASDQGIHCLPLTKQFYTYSQVVKWTCLLKSNIR